VERRLLGKTGLAVSVLGFGTAEIGFENAEQATVDRLVGICADAGVNFMDTAECYEDSEEKLGLAMSRRRQDFLLFTKCGHAAGLEGVDWTPAVLTKGLERSLRRLRTEYVDLLQLHSCSADILERTDVVQALVEARQSGKTRFIGYSGDSTDALAAITTGVFDTLQTSINLADQEAITLTIPAARQRSMGILAKRPLANAVWKHTQRPSNPYYQEYWDRLDRIGYPFLQACSLTDSLTTAVRFTLSAPGVCAAIIGSKSEDRLQKNFTFVPPSRLPDDEFEYIRGLWEQRSLPSWAGQV